MKISLIIIALCSICGTCFSQALFPYRSEGLWGYLDSTGSIVIEPQFEMCGFFAEGLAYAQVGDALGYIDETGQLVIPADYPAATNFHEGYASVMVDEDWMVINKQGEIMMEQYFANPVTFNDGLARFKLEMGLRSKYGFINPFGDTVIYPSFEFVSDFSEGLCMASPDGQTYGYINTSGEWVIQPTFELGVLIKYNDEYDFADKNFSNGYVAVQKDEKYGLMDKTGKLVLDYSHEFIGKYAEGLAPAKKGDKYGYIDLSGKWVIKPTFSGAEKFHNGLAAVSKGPLFESQWGFINKEGKVVIPITIAGYFSMESPMIFWDGVVPCYIEQGVFGYINRKGEVVWKME
jgi:hypothetical protein